MASDRGREYNQSRREGFYLKIKLKMNIDIYKSLKCIISYRILLSVCYRNVYRQLQEYT